HLARPPASAHGSARPDVDRPHPPPAWAAGGVRRPDPSGRPAGPGPTGPRDAPAKAVGSPGRTARTRTHRAALTASATRAPPRVAPVETAAARGGPAPAPPGSRPAPARGWPAG